MNADLRKILVEGAAELGVELRSREVGMFTAYLELLQLWGKKMNLTSRLESKEIVIYHFLDSLAAFRLVSEKGKGRAVDIGAGAGFPALPLKIALSELHFLLVDSSRKKVSFCEEVVRRLALVNTDVLWGRAEALGKEGEYAASFDWAFVRAVGEAGKMFGICRFFLRPGGTAILYKGAFGGEELRILEEETSRRGDTVRIVPATVPHLKGSRTLVQVRKCST